MKTIATVLILILALFSVADRSHVVWTGVRAISFAVCLWLASANPSRLIYGLAAAFASIALAGIAGLDLAIACLAFALLDLKLHHLATVVAGLGLAGALSFSYSQWDRAWTPLFFPFHNRNHYAVFCELGLPLLLYAYRRKNNRFFLAIGAVMLVAALAGGSRTGAILLLLEATALWVAVAGKEKAWMAIPAIAIAASIFLLVSGGERIQNPLAGDHRLEIWQSGVEMVAARPLKGWGIGEFARGYPAFAHFDNGEFVNAAHSDWIEWAVELGILPLTAFLGFFFWWMRKTIQSYPSWGILIGALHAAVDYPFHLPGLLLFAAALAGSIAVYGTKIETESTDRQRRNRRTHSP
ncbi:MAG: O-antigen ligase family protein [Acidobacteria bacterium]|nr:O-antigen ligase family protein [Acidobacteriota bacterium]